MKNKLVVAWVGYRFMNGVEEGECGYKRATGRILVGMEMFCILMVVVDTQIHTL